MLARVHSRLSYQDKTPMKRTPAPTERTVEQPQSKLVPTPLPRPRLSLRFTEKKDVPE